MYRIRVGRAIDSAGLVADGLHARTDGLTSLAVLVGVGGVAIGWEWADAAVGLLISVALLGVLRSAVRQVGAGLMDAVDPHLMLAAREALRATPGVKSVTSLRMRWVGHDLFAEASLTADPSLTMAQAHDLAHLAEGNLGTVLPRLAAATVHVGPAATPGAESAGGW